MSFDLQLRGLRVLVTGGTGLLGYRIALDLVAALSGGNGAVHGASELFKSAGEHFDMVLARGGEAKWTDVYAKSGRRPAEFLQLVDGLVQAGRALVHVEENTKARWIRVVR